MAGDRAERSRWRAPPSPVTDALIERIGRARGRVRGIGRITRNGTEVAWTGLLSVAAPRGVVRELEEVVVSDSLADGSYEIEVEFDGSVSTAPCRVKGGELELDASSPPEWHSLGSEGWAAACRRETDIRGDTDADEVGQ